MTGTGLPAILAGIFVFNEGKERRNFK